jgi:hypothetical protein
VDKRHTENQQTNNCGQTPHRKPTEKQLSTNATQKTNRERTVDKRHTENQQRNNCGQTPHRKQQLVDTNPTKRGDKRQTTVGKTPHKKSTDKQLWTKVTQQTSRQTTVDKRHRNQQTNNCGQTSHRKSTDKQLWTNATETKRQTTVDKRHTEYQ